MNNICKFIPVNRSPSELHIIKFIKETKIFKKEPTFKAQYTVALITSGKGVFHTSNTNYPLKKGSIFITSPSTTYGIENKDSLNCIYISFIGLKGVPLYERVCNNVSSPVFYGFDELIPMWTDAVENSTEDNIDLLAEGLIMYTLGKIVKANKSTPNPPKNIYEIKKFIDANYTNHNLSIEYTANNFGYNKKYLSGLFKKHFKINFTEYLSQIRIQHSISLMQQGFTSVKEIAYLSGFSDSLYFSKMFKKKLGVSPKEFISSL